MKIKNKKLLFFILFLSIIAVIFVFITISKRKNDISAVPADSLNLKNNNSKRNDDSIMIDFNGDGTKEVLNVTEKETGMVNMELFDLEGNKIAGLLDELYLFNTTFFKVTKLNENSSKEYLEWDMVTGPHQIQTVFLTVIGDFIQPIYSMDFEKKTMYSPFYTSRGEILVEDANKDGLKEVIESVDEYPVNAPRLEDPTLEETVRETFSKEGFNEKAIEDAVAIMARENYGKGRGRRVVMAIHSFVDEDPPYFRRLHDEEYEAIANPFINAVNELLRDRGSPGLFMKYSDLEQDSKDFNEFVRNFWTVGRIYEFPIPDKSAD